MRFHRNCDGIECKMEKSRMTNSLTDTTPFRFREMSAFFHFGKEVDLKGKGNYRNSLMLWAVVHDHDRGRIILKRFKTQNEAQSYLDILRQQRHDEELSVVFNPQGDRTT